MKGTRNWSGVEWLERRSSMVFTSVCDGLTEGNFWTDMDAKPLVS